MINAPRKAAVVPKRLTAPEVPLSTLLKDLIKNGFDLLIEPISEAHVSELAAALQIQKPKSQRLSSVAK